MGIEEIISPMNIFDTFDKIIENVQQIPLDVYLFVKKNKEISKKISYLNRKMFRLQKSTLKKNVNCFEQIEETYKKLKKYNKKSKNNIKKLHKILSRIYNLDSGIIKNEHPSLILPVLSIENINRIVKVEKMMLSGPSYCTCKQKAYDCMIACNNTECKYKWFHFECIGITHPPKNIWYCQDCKRKIK